MAEIDNFDLDAFLAGIESDQTKRTSPTDYLNKVSMSSRDNQGTVTFIPFMSHAYNNFYVKISGVLEMQGKTTLTKSGYGWYKLLPIEYYGQLTEDELALYNEIKSTFNEIVNNYEVDRDDARIRTYTLFTGVQISHSNKDGAKVSEELNECPCLYVFPSYKPVNAFVDAINAKMDIMKGDRKWLAALLSPAATGRQGVVQIQFKMSAGVGYDCSVAFEFNNALSPIVDESKDYSELVPKFDDALATFVGWGYDRDNAKMFNLNYMKEFRDELRMWLQNLKQQASNTQLPPPAATVNPTVPNAEPAPAASASSGESSGATTASGKKPPF